MQNFRKLIVWEKSHQLALKVYSATEQFPDGERFGLVSQMRRAAASIPTNIAEGTGRQSQKDLARFLDIAMGSTCELEYQIILSRDLRLISTDVARELEADVAEVRRMLYGFLRRVRDNL